MFEVVLLLGWMVGAYKFWTFLILVGLYWAVGGK
jgi:hypothetical protein